VLQASSPDEVALVQFAESLGYLLVSRDIRQITIKNLAGGEEKFTILENFPFSSERKRMGIVLKDDATGTILFYLKGADTIIMPRLDKISASFVAEECESLAKEGLRTLVMTQRIVPEAEYNTWKYKFLEASKDLKNREEKENKVIEELEKNMELLGVSGVEDLLQDDIKTVMENLRAGGIKIWMLTGDKLETAKCIAISTGLKASNQPFLEISDSLGDDEFIEMMEKFEVNPTSVIVIEGGTLKKVFEDPKMKYAFIKYASMAPAVVCCRCAPTQKSEITEAIKKQLKKVVCSIGDGGNDVGMIQSANLGVGIEGKEGKQAALAADFSIKQFKTIAPLILWAGRLCYVRTALLSNFIIHRGLIISIIQFLFSIAFNFTTIQIYNGYLMLGYATLFTSLPVFCLIFDEDVKYRQVFDYPQLYLALQKGRALSIHIFLMWAWMSIYQGGIIILFTIWFFEHSFIDIVTITFTSLILIEYLNVIFSINRWHSMISLSLGLSVIVYSIVLFFMRNMFGLSPVTGEIIYKVVILVMVAWLPVKIGQIVKRIVDPSLLDKVRKEARDKIKYASGTNSL